MTVTGTIRAGIGAVCRTVNQGFLVSGTPAPLATAVELHEAVAGRAAWAGLNVVNVGGVHPHQVHLEVAQVVLHPIRCVSDDESGLHGFMFGG